MLVFELQCQMYGGSSPVIRPFQILVRYRRDRKRPENAESHSIITHASCRLGSVKGGRHVTHFRVVEKGMVPLLPVSSSPCHRPQVGESGRKSMITS
jgi:hypothetical protein